MSHWDHYFHIVWTTKWRQPLITPEREEPLFKLIFQLGQEMKFEVLAVNGTSDHVHLLIKTGAKIDLSSIVARVKGGTSSFINDLNEHQHNFRWQEGYFSATVTPNHVAKIETYIKNQKAHHKDGSTHAYWEKTEQERVP